MEAKKLLLLAGVMGCSLLMSGCSVSQLPSHEAVKADVNASMQEVVDLLPEGTQVSLRPESTPYPCEDKLSLGSGKGVFYTGQLEATLPPTADASHVVDDLPARLGEQWKASKTGVALSSSAVILTDTKRQVQLNVMDVSKAYGGTSVIDITGISRCATSPTN